MDSKRIKPIRIDHFYLLVSDLEQSKKYYESIFNFATKPLPDVQEVLMVESDKVHFFLKQIHQTDFDFKEQHISFEVSSIQKIIKKLDHLGIQTYEIGVFDKFENHNYEWLEWRDPDGIRIECIESIR